MAVVRVYIVRHGETEENRIGVMQGHLDSKLNAAGVEQATRTAKALEHVRFAEAHSSDLSRAIKVCMASRLGPRAELQEVGYPLIHRTVPTVTDGRDNSRRTTRHRKTGAPPTCSVTRTGT